MHSKQFRQYVDNIGVDVDVDASVDVYGDFDIDSDDLEASDAWARCALSNVLFHITLQHKKAAKTLKEIITTGST